MNFTFMNRGLQCFTLPEFFKILKHFFGVKLLCKYENYFPITEIHNLIYSRNEQSTPLSNNFE